MGMRAALLPHPLFTGWERNAKKMPPWKKACRRLIGLLDSVVSFAALALMVCVMLLAGYSLWDANQVYRAAEATVYQAYIPTEEDTRSFDELRAINPEVIGWLRVNDTEINYPLLQAEDNSKYVNTDVEGNFSLSGAIFLHCSNSPRFTDYNSIIYGHHMEKRKMFGDLGLFAEQAFFDEHPYGNLFFDGKDHGIEFFAFMLVDAYDDIFTLVNPDQHAGSDAAEALEQAYLDSVYEKSMYVREIDVTTQDNLVLLSTCTSVITNGRHILVGRLTDTVYPEAEGSVNLGTGVDRLGGSLGQVPLWLWILAAVLLLLVILIFILRRRQRSNREGKQHEG